MRWKRGLAFFAYAVAIACEPSADQQRCGCGLGQGYGWHEHDRSATDSDLSGSFEHRGEASLSVPSQAKVTTSWGDPGSLSGGLRVDLVTTARVQLADAGAGSSANQSHLLLRTARRPPIGESSLADLRADVLYCAHGFADEPSCADGSAPEAELAEGTVNVDGEYPTEGHDTSIRFVVDVPAREGHPLSLHIEGRHAWTARGECM